MTGSAGNSTFSKIPAESSGHTINPQGICPPKRKLQAIGSFPLPFRFRYFVEFTAVLITIFFLRRTALTWCILQRIYLWALKMLPRIYQKMLQLLRMQPKIPLSSLRREFDLIRNLFRYGC